ncbi:hypothetical protein GCM10025857_26990 [Alicyclobacillus contaminans]|nr:hypothetical protein GCM10025857_26990 [Alicyclobacillus contaminans]
MEAHAFGRAGGLSRKGIELIGSLTPQVIEWIEGSRNGGDVLLAAKFRAVCLREVVRIEPHFVKTDGMAFKKEMIDLQFR